MIFEDPTIVQRAMESEGFQQLSPQLKVALFLGSMVFISSALVTLTAFTRIVIVLSFVRRALSTQEIPPTPVILGLSLFLTLFVMAPTFRAIENDAVGPYLDGTITGAEAWQSGSDALRAFMITQTRKSDLMLFVDLAGMEGLESPESTPMRVLVPAFVTSELKTAFIMGFCLYLPFVLIDLVVSVILMSLGMMMMPPVVISTPFKLLLFVLVDGWQLVVRALSLSFG
ncbi:Flagellar biosynthetic protein FliP precursor [Maioricimonas rarisocia]|uniref:Flagellar biosynthetic protein FliP n=1 Tax=Maioricimonas rarisocia TaxID=2528026 RepID=A0A517ZCN8_9PLAN|nr:flagellar type III secretion system pore protein FliP [Maioricimonas rarisocia]QDU40227.1 Flagellar biosynthetic protein FliP precursor [Maioricimonas rarisocia]